MKLLQPHCSPITTELPRSCKDVITWAGIHQQQKSCGLPCEQLCEATCACVRSSPGERQLWGFHPREGCQRVGGYPRGWRRQPHPPLQKGMPSLSIVFSCASRSLQGMAQLLLRDPSGQELMQISKYLAVSNANVLCSEKKFTRYWQLLIRGRFFTLNQRPAQCHKLR